MSEPTEKEVSVPWPGKTSIVVTLTTPPKGTEHSGFGLLLGPGAGGDEKTVILTAIANEVARQGHFCARYRAKVPNLGFRVSVCTRVMEYLFHPTLGLYPLKGCFLGGHSMGTRVAGTVAAQLAGGLTSSTESTPAKKTAATTAKGKKGGRAAAKSSTATTLATGDSNNNNNNNNNSTDYPTHYIPGLVLLSYPLHTAENTKALRDQILYDIPSTTSTLFISGLKDTMCQPTLFAKVFKDMKAMPREVVQVVDADHGLGFGKSKPAQAKNEALCTAMTEWTIAFMDETISALHEGEEGKTKTKTKTKKKKNKGPTTATKKKAELRMTDDEWTVAVSTIA
ncbi:MAG: hypothetical protein J3Q66DRAFT_70639 [Benniella sp.]|nr:MAG: hypothetical protein J3Q66DRAFT_70639 [Benniella sp.]